MNNRSITFIIFTNKFSEWITLHLNWKLCHQITTMVCISTVKLIGNTFQKFLSPLKETGSGVTIILP